MDREKVVALDLGRAVAHLRAAKDLGLFRQPRFAASLESDADLAAVRRLASWPGLRAELRADR